MSPLDHVGVISAYDQIKQYVIESLAVLSDCDVQLEMEGYDPTHPLRVKISELLAQGRPQ